MTRPADIAGIWSALAKLPGRTPAQRKRDKLAAAVWRSVDRSGKQPTVKRPTHRAFSGEHQQIECMCLTCARWRAS